MAFSAIWSFILLAATFLLPNFRLRKIQKAWLVILVVASLARLAPAIALPVGASYDIRSYRMVARSVIHRQDVYTNPETEDRHPYLPLQMYWFTAARWLSQSLDVSFAKVVKLYPILADILIAVFIYLSLLRSAGPEKALMGGLLYAVNPVAVFVSAYHGQFDAIPALMILLALFYFLDKPLLSAAWLGAGILVKSWPVMILPVLLAKFRQWQSALRYLGILLAVPMLGLAVYILIFLANPLVVLKTATSYNMGIGVWGYTYLLRLPVAFVPSWWSGVNFIQGMGRWVTIATLGLVWWYKARKESSEAGVLTFFVAFLAFTHAFAIQYLMWVIPFAVLCLETGWLKRFTLAAFSYMFLAYFTLILQVTITNLLPMPMADWFLIIPFGVPAWLVCLAWAVQRLRSTTPPA